MKRRSPQPHAPLPLFPLPNVVHFPGAELRLHVFEPRYRQLVRDLMQRESAERRIGIVLLKPGWRETEDCLAAIFPAGTAGRLVSVRTLPDGRSNIRLRGEFRFAIDREVEGPDTPYRQALVRPLSEPEPHPEEPSSVALRREILARAARLQTEMGARFPLDGEALADLARRSSLAEIVNRLAQELDVPPLRKMQLLAEELEERGTSLLHILRSRERVLDLLRPFRHLRSAASTN
jgi:Lon protease-like protein